MDPKMLLRAMNPSICSIEGGGDPAGGGDGGAPPAGGGEFDPSEFQNEMKDFVVRAVNGAVSTHLTRALDNRFEENNNALLSKFKELIPQAPPAPEPKASGNPDIDAIIKNAQAPLLKQLDEMKAASARAADAAKAERENRLRQEEFTSLQIALTGAGVPGPLAEAAVHKLHTSLERDSQGNILFVSKESGPTGPYEERIAVADGVARFLKTDEGKHFLPARPVSGSGNRGGAAPGARQGQQGDREAVGEMLAALMGVGG